MKLYFEWGTRQVRKKNEELCGDSLAILRHSDSVTLALSDGLGSGVKANILATLTTRIVMNMLENAMPLDEVVQTLSETLPVDKVRKLAYSTFAIAQFFSYGSARVVEFDTPPVILLRNRKLLQIAYDERSIKGKCVRETVLQLKRGDWVVFVSDGVLNAGIGGVYPLGWGWNQAALFLEEHAHRDLSAEDLADAVAETVKELYVDAPGDDVSIAVIKVRSKQVATVFTGPPADRATDDRAVYKFLGRVGKLAVCGGSTAKIVARHLGLALEVDLDTATQEVPPMARLEGIDLVTEGILTLTRVNELLRSGAGKKTVRFQTDGAACLIRLLLDTDHIHFMVGQSINPAHQNPDLPNQLDIRQSVVRDIAEELARRGKEISIERI